MNDHIPFTHTADVECTIRQQRHKTRAEALAQLRHDVAVLVDGYILCEDVYLAPEHVHNVDPNDPWTLFDELPDYPADLNACAAVEAHLVALGFGAQYVAALTAELGDLVPAHGLPLILAAPETRCRAMVVVMQQRGPA